MHAVMERTDVQATAFMGMYQRSSAQETLSCQQAAGRPACFNQMQVRQARQSLRQRRAGPDDQLLSDTVSRQTTHQEFGLALTTAKTTRKIDVTKQGFQPGRRTHPRYPA